jgi:2-polyprenyl-3-methyl-5-hydroxy-6-metoxy-1,4-benzoquinol methylase
LGEGREDAVDWSTHFIGLDDQAGPGREPSCHSRLMKIPEDRLDSDWSRLRQHDVEELWDHSRNPHVASAYAGRLATLLDLVSRLAGRGGRILDVGCAQGTLGLMLAERGYSVSLLDVRAVNIEYARARYERGNVDYYSGFLSDEMPPRSDYDVVVCTEVLEHVREPAMLLSQLAHKARPGGAVCLTTPNGDYVLSALPSFGRAAQEVIDKAEANSLDGDAHRFLYTREELVALARGVGLRIEAHGFFLPLWLEGHAKTRYLHRLFYRLRGDIVRLPAMLGEDDNRLARRLCSSQWLVARRD